MTDSVLLQIQDLKFGWGEDLLLNIPFFSVNRGEKVFLYGPSGSGKSTFLNLITGVLKSQSGKIECLGRSLNQMNTSERDQFRGDHMGFVFQQFNLIPYLSSEENILLPLQFSKYKKNKILNIKNEVERLSKKLEIHNELQKKPTQLSVGQQQRVAAVRALLGSPELIIADEPTSSLDQERRDSFLELLLFESKKENSSIIFVSHDKTLQKHFDTFYDIRSVGQ